MPGFAAATAFDAWIRGGFRDFNTELEEAYFRLSDPAAVDDVGGDIKAAIEREGRERIAAIIAADIYPTDEAEAYDMLGNVGLYMASLRRHEVTNPDREQQSPLREASGLAARLAVGLGIAPRFATAHINLSNLAHHGQYKSFTALPAELLFIEYNCLSILAFIRAADVLRRVGPLGVTHPVSLALLKDAEAALRDVVAYNDILARDLDIDRFFFNIRPYFKTYNVGRTPYRGANAGDFAGINEIDLMLGLCSAADPGYSAMLLDKRPYMTPDDQRLLDQACRRGNLLDRFLAADLSRAGAAQAEVFLAICDRFGETADQHHQAFVIPFLETPSARLAGSQLRQVTASGPPLSVVVGALASLRDKRMAKPRDDGSTRHADLQELRCRTAAARGAS